MAYGFIHPSNGDNGDNGSTLDLALATVDYAATSGGFSAGDTVYISRTLDETPTSDIASAYDGTILNSIKFIGCPRAAETGTGDFTQGESVITSMSFATVRSQHVCRKIKNDSNGDWYTITAICMKIDYDNEQVGGPFVKGSIVKSDNGDPGEGKIQMVVDNGTTGSIWIVVRKGTFANNDQLSVGVTYIADVNGTPDADDGLCIDYNYAGSNDTTANLTIDEDPDYDHFMAYNDSGDTIKKADWQAETKNLPKLDFNGTAYQWIISGDQFHELVGIEFTGSTDSYGALHLATGARIELCHFINNQNAMGFRVNHQMGKITQIKNCLCFGNDTGASQRGATFEKGGVEVDGLFIYNSGSYGLYINEAGLVRLENINLGIELGNGDDNLYVANSQIIGNNVSISTDDSSDITMATDNTRQNYLAISNYQKTLKNIYRRWYGYIVSSNDGSGADVNLRSGGAAYVLDWQPGGSSDQPNRDRAYLIFEDHFYIQTASTSKNYRYYVQNDGAINSTVNADIWLEAECISTYNSATVYKKEKILSTDSANPMPAKADADDWGQYVTVAVTTPAIDCIVRIRCYCTYYHATNNIFVDPKVSIT
jgi:hypothetical protein